MLVKLKEALKSMLNNSDPEYVDRIWNHGLTCTPRKIEQQDDIAKRFVKKTLCSEIEWFKLAAFAVPDIRSVLDVGSNKGLLSAAFLSLWGGGGYGVYPQAVYREETRLGFIPPGEFQGHCNHEKTSATPLTCRSGPFLRRADGSVHCNETRSDFRLYSFDGSGSIDNMTQHIIHSFTSPPPSSREAASLPRGMWRHAHLALSAEPGVANFTLPYGDRMSDPSFEGERLLLRYRRVELDTYTVYARSFHSWCF